MKGKRFKKERVGRATGVGGSKKRAERRAI